MAGKKFFTLNKENRSLDIRRGGTGFQGNEAISAGKNKEN